MAEENKVKEQEQEEKEERCEECDTEEDEKELIDVILNGALARLCRRCAHINQAIVMEKLSVTSAAERIARIPALAEELRKNMPDITSSEVTIGDLRRLQEKKQGEESNKDTVEKEEV